MPRQDLQQYLRERLTALDPTLDVSAGSRADTEVIQPVLEYFGADVLDTDVRYFVLDTIRRQFPTLGIQQDGVVDDLVSKIVGALMAPLAREVSLLRRRQYPDPRVHTLESVRMLPGALFVPFNEGGRASGTVRLYYVSPTSEVVRPENVFYARNGARFTPVTTQSITRAEMQLNYEESLYYFDVRVIAAEAGSSGNVEPGTIDRAPSITRAVRVTNKLRFTGGGDADSVESYLVKAENWPTQLSLSVYRGIKAILIREYADAIYRVEVVGMGDPEMTGDIIRGGNLGPAVRFPGKDGDLVPLNGVDGTYRPSLSLSLRSYLFHRTDLPYPSFLNLGPAGKDLTSDYYIALHGSRQKVYAESRIKRVISASDLELEEPVVPFESDIRWEVRRKYITISDVPGGILYPTTPDGEVEIRDDTVHVGGRTDVYIHADPDDGSTTLDAVSDENDIGSGEHARRGGSALWMASNHDWVRLDVEDTELVIDQLAESIIGGTTIKTSMVKGSIDLGDIRVRPTFFGVNTDTPIWSDIVLINIAGNWERYQIESIAVDPADGHILFKLDRTVTSFPSPVPMKIVRNVPSGIQPGRTMLVVNKPTGTAYYRVVDYASGFYQGTATNPDNMRFEVRLYPKPNFPPGESYSWVLVDDIDINLADPKQLRVSGLDLVTSMMSPIVTTASSVNMEARGVKKDDILRILDGPYAGDYVIAADPNGPGSALLTLTSPISGSGTFRFEIFSPVTPIDPPLVDMKTVRRVTSVGGSMIGAGGTGTDVPPARALGAVSTQFANAGTGLKWRRTDCITGPMARSPLPLKSYVLAPGAHEVRLQITSLTWGRFGYTLNTNPAGGFWDLSTDAHRRLLLQMLNSTLPADYVCYTDSDGNVVDISSVPDLAAIDIYLTGNPYNADDISPEGGFFLRFMGSTREWVDDTANTDVLLTDHTVMFNGIDNLTLSSRFAISAWNDVVQIETGVNANKAGVIWTMLWQPDHLYVYTFPFVQMLPERNVTGRIGSPSVGWGRTFFREPTMFEAGPRTTYKTGNQTFIPDPRISSTIYPGYPDTVQPQGAVRVGSDRVSLPLPYGAYGIRLLDSIVPGNRRIIFAFDFALGNWTPLTDQGFSFLFEGGNRVDVSFPAIAGGYSRSAVIKAFNDALGETMAKELDNYPSGTQKVMIETQRRISTLTGSIGAFPGLGPTDPVDCDTKGNLSFMGRAGVPFYVIGYDTQNPNIIKVFPNLPPASETSTAQGVQFKIQRFATQRFSAAKIAENKHENGLYYADVDLIALGAGDEWNLGPDVPLTVDGYESLGYTLSCENESLSFSMLEKPWLHITPWFLDPSATADKPDQQVAVYGSKLELRYSRSGLVESAQLLFNSEEERENNEFVLARCMRPCRVYLGVRYTNGPLESEVVTALTDLIQKQAIALDMDSIIDLLKRLGAERILTPVEMAGAYVRQDRSESFVMAKDRIEVTRLAAFIVGRLRIQRVG